LIVCDPAVVLPETYALTLVTLPAVAVNFAARFVFPDSASQLPPGVVSPKIVGWSTVAFSE
jgi:hypothetical protein